MNTELLLATCDWVEKNVPADKFDLASWIAHYDVDEVRIDQVTEMPCGSVGCFMGWATFMPELKARGLARTDSGVPQMPNPSTLQDDPDRIVFGFHAAAKLFDIPFRDALRLFDSDFYSKNPDVSTPLGDVLDRVRGFAAGTLDSEGRVL